MKDGPTGAVYLCDIFCVGHVDELDDVKGWIELAGKMQSIVVDIDCAVRLIVAGIRAGSDDELCIWIRQHRTSRIPFGEGNEVGKLGSGCKLIISSPTFLVVFFSVLMLAAGEGAAAIYRR